VELKQEINMDQQLLQYALTDRLNAQQNGVSLNPFSTPRPQLLWQQGWDGVRPDNLVDGSQNWRYWERGRIASTLA
jgi:hypothetical protein